MNFIKALCLGIVALCFTQQSLAADEGRHTLRVGSRSAIWPGQELPIYFDALSPYLGPGYYDVHCRIYADTFSHIPVTAYMSSLNYATVVLNGYQMDMYGDYLYPGTNTLDILDVNAMNGALYLRNEDWLILGDSFYLMGDCWSNYHY